MSRMQKYLNSFADMRLIERYWEIRGSLEGKPEPICQARTSKWYEVGDLYKTIKDSYPGREFEIVMVELREGKEKPPE
jgi:hypothetical protein